MAHYLVTGIAGFIGSALAHRLLQQGHTVTGVDNLHTGKRENVPHGVHFFKANVQDPSLYENLQKKQFDAIFHIAGQSSGEISFDDPVYDLETNTKSTLLLLDMARKIKCKRFIYASSMSVYGDQPDEPVEETACPVPLSFYGVGKLASEHYLRLYEQFGIATTSLRLFNVYGPGQNMDNMRQGMVSIYMAMMVKDNHIHIKGSPSRFRDFVYIDDVVGAFLACLDHPQSRDKAINIGTNSKTTVGKLIDLLSTLSPEPITLEYSGQTAGDMRGIFADISMAAKYLGFDPSVSLEEGLKRMYHWYTQELQK